MTAPADTRISVAQAIAQACVRHGVRRLYGLPGGGSCLDVIEAFNALDVPFVLARTEAAAGMMAGAEAEADGGLGVVLATQGPGTASLLNAVSQALLDRIPLLVITDGWTPSQLAAVSHQVIDQQALMAPIVKARSRLEGDDVVEEIEQLLRTAQRMPWGPVYIELTGANAVRTIPSAALAPAVEVPVAPPAHSLDAARTLLAQARRPVLLVGLEVARSAHSTAQFGALARALGCPVLATYKAKGVLPDDDPQMVGLFTGGAAERPCVEAADLIVLCGFDPVELIGRPWPYTAPVLDLSPIDHAPHYVVPTGAVRGPLAESLEALRSTTRAPGWRPAEISALRDAMATTLAYPGDAPGLSPELVVKTLARAAAGLDARISVDAGAHMFSAMAFWPARRRGDVLISNGLSTMGYALPAAVALALATPERRAIAFTGDGGLLMCLGELATAAQQRVRVCVVVFDDSSLSLIQIKQESRGLERRGVDGPALDFAAIARGAGWLAFNARSRDELEAAAQAALAADGPALICATIDATGYLAQSIALRG